MESKYLRLLPAIGLSLTCVLLSSGYDGRNGSKRQSVSTEENAEKAVLDRDFKIKYGQEVTVKGAGLKVKFESVLDDSRCPKDVTCVWAGDAKILISVRRANARESKIELHTNGQFNVAGEYQDYVIKLVALDPYPRTSAKVKPNSYVATLLIGKRITTSVTGRHGRV
jgi:hypothetical protein